MRPSQNLACHFVTATAYKGFFHGLAQPCLQLTLDVFYDERPGAGLDAVSLDHLLVPMPTGRTLRLSDDLKRFEQTGDMWRLLKPLLERCHELLVRTQESAGWPVASGAFVHSLRVQSQQRWTVSLFFPSLFPMALMQALPWLFLQMGDDRPPPGKLAKAPATLEELLKILAKNAPQGTNTRLLLTAAYARGVPVQRLSGSVMMYGWGCRSRWMDSSFTDAASVISAKLARNKVEAHRLLSRSGFPVAEQVGVSSLESAVSEAGRMGYPVVIKPSNLDGGRGVEAGLNDETALRAAYSRSLRHSKSLVLEKHVVGHDFRLGVLQGELAWATYREPAGVWGNGVATLNDLIIEANRDPRRGTRRWSQMVPITINDEAAELLREQGVDMNDVVPMDRFVRLRRAANTSSGGRPMDVTGRVHPDNAALAIGVARLFRLDIAGIDFITPDISRSWREVAGVVCEVNGQPQFSVTRPDIPGRVISAIVKGHGRIPVVILLSSLPSGQLTAQVNQRLQGLSINPGWVLADGMTGGSGTLGSAAQTSFDKVQALLLDTSVEVLLAATDGLDWLESGMPLDRVDLVISDGAEDVRVAQLLRNAGVDHWWRLPTMIEGHESIPADFVAKLVDFIACLLRAKDEDDFA